jgi:hypothetical protein
MKISQHEIEILPAGKLLDTIIQEYIVGDFPSRWSNSEQRDIPCHWFEEWPRSCAEDDDNRCAADFVPNYSGNLDEAMLLTKRINQPLSTKTIGNVSWATFNDVPFDQYRYGWVSGERLPLAICRAALIYKRTKG